MAFELEQVVPWGRSLEEYKSMFDLNIDDLQKKIISFGDGPASFNAEMNNNVTSIDPIYQYSKHDIKKRIDETKDIVIAQLQANKESFVWNQIKDIEQLEHIRMTAMSNFLNDFEKGKIEKRYIYHELPQKTDFPDNHFELGLSSHFLLLYSQLGIEFHIASISEMLRVCNEIRIFPIVNLNAEESEVLQDILDYFSKEYICQITNVSYEFQKNGNQMLQISKK